MIIKVLIKQFFHCLGGTFKYHPCQEINHYNETRFLGIVVWKKYYVIQCICGKVFYESKLKL